MHVRHALGALVLGILACREPSETTTGGQLDDDDDTYDDSGGDTGGPSRGPFRPYWYTLEATYGFDPASGVVNPRSPKGELQSAVYVVMGSYEWKEDSFSESSDHYCVLVFPLVEDGRDPPFVAENGLWHGVAYDADLSPPLSTCTGDHELDPDDWGRDPERLVADYIGGAGIGPHTMTQLDYVFDPDILPYVAGGFVSNGFLNTAYGQHESAYYAYGQQMDENHELQIDAANEPLLILEEEIPVAGAPRTLQRARYSMYSYYYYY